MRNCIHDKISGDIFKFLKGTDNRQIGKIYFILSFLWRVFLFDPFIFDIISHEECDDDSTGSDSSSHPEHPRIADRVEENFNLFVKNESSFYNYDCDANRPDWW